MFKPYFEQIIPEGEGIEIDVVGIKCYITHYPSQARSHLFNLVGHIHSAWRYQLNMFNVGVDANHFAPVDMDKTIPFLLNAITNFYDDDVFAAYNDANTQYRNTRGKKGSYFLVKPA